MSNIQVRHTVESLFAWKLEMVEKIGLMSRLEREVHDSFQAIGGYAPTKLDRSYGHRGSPDTTKLIDQAAWSHLVQMFHLEKYMLCTDWAKMKKEIDDLQTPEFTPDNANAWLDGLKGLIQENVRTLVKQVYRSIIDGTYFVGTGYNATKKKRNNNGIDSMFILRTNDYHGIFAYWDKPTITDDLEKVCYLLDGKTLPDKTIKTMMRADKVSEARDDYMKVKVYQNGNTHYTLEDDIREKLNRYGPDGAVIGEDIKIKVFSREELWRAS